MRRTLRTATEADLGMVWSGVRGTHIFEGREELNRFFAEAPWRLQVTDAGEAAVLERWRDHLGILSIRGLWCAERRIAELVRAIDAVSVRQGFADTLSPVVAEGMTGAYEDAGMCICQRIVTMRLGRVRCRAAVRIPVPEGVTLRLATLDDLAAMLAVDILAFEAFWRGDASSLGRYLPVGRLVVAEVEGEVIGYTLCTAGRGEGMLGRLAVVPREQGRGVGTLLLHDVLDYMVRTGVSAVSLCTQEDNATSRSLYGRAGFEQVGGASVFLAFGRTPETQPM